MIIDPDMPDHWKVRMLADALDDELAPVYLIRIWGHCQNRKKYQFSKLPPNAVKAICRYPGSADDLDAALNECGFIERDKEGVLVVGWAEHNQNLWSAWENGKKGGRPKKPKENPPDNPKKPNGNPRDTGRSPDEGDEGDELNEGEGDTGGKPPARKTSLPKNFTLSGRVKRWAEEKGHGNLEEHFENFITQAQAKGYKYADWDSALMNAIRKDWAEVGKGKPEDDRFRGAL